MDIKNPIIFFSLLIISNVVAYSLNIGISIFWNKIVKYKATTTKKEVLSSLLTLLINILIAVPGYFLWIEGIIVFSDSNFWVTFVFLFLLMDFLMYFLHWASHNINSLRKIHLRHHEHSERFNCLSLYYMSPWESILFGLLLTLITILFSLNIYGFIVFLCFNWFYGVITHLNINSSNPHFLVFTTNFFHKTHHQLSCKNYGFYTFIWDKLFKTENNI